MKNIKNKIKKKHIIIVGIIMLVAILLITITYYVNNKVIERTVEDGELIYREEDGIDIIDDIEIVKLDDRRVMRLHFKEKNRVYNLKIKVYYYQENKNIYTDSILYEYKNDELHRTIDLPITTEYYKILDSSKDFKDPKNREEVKVYYDYLKMVINR